MPRELITMPLLVGKEGEAELMALTLEVKGDELVPYPRERVEGEDPTQKSSTQRQVSELPPQKVEREQHTVKMPARFTQLPDQPTYQRKRANKRQEQSPAQQERLVIRIPGGKMNRISKSDDDRKEDTRMG